ncbi:MAG: hypothetical protein ABIN13_03670, partial [Mucilaginibacter sp.]
FLEEYKQYVIDFEIAVRLKERGIDIQLLPIRFNHLRSGLHREFMDNNYSTDVHVFLKTYPKYEASIRQVINSYMVKDTGKARFVSEITPAELLPWGSLKQKGEFIKKVKRKLRSLLKR